MFKVGFQANCKSVLRLKVVLSVETLRCYILPLEFSPNTVSALTDTLVFLVSHYRWHTKISQGKQALINRLPFLN